MFDLVFEGISYFSPNELFELDTSNAVMSATLFSDLNDPNNASNPKNKLENPNHFMEQFGDVPTLSIVLERQL